jgi:hypothetical protein
MTATGMLAHDNGLSSRERPPASGPPILFMECLAAVRIEDSHRDGVRRLINLGHKRDGARDASCVGAPSYCIQESSR